MDSLSVMKLLVIGGTGFIGNYLVQAACKRGWHVSSLSLNRLSPENQQTGIDHFFVDLSDRTALFDTLNGRTFDYVVNLGGYIDHSENTWLDKAEQRVYNRKQVEQAKSKSFYY